MKTYAPKPQDIERRWYVIDADGAVLGRLATEVASILRGKHKPIFAPHADTGDHVIVVNAKGVRLTGGKETKKIAYRHSGYPGGLSETEYGRLMATRPSYVVEKAVKGMLPHNRLGRSMFKKLSVYDGPTHRHEAQQPQALKLGEIPKWEGLPAPKIAEPAPVVEPAPKRSAAKRTTAKRSTAARSAAKPKTATAKPKAPAKPKASAAKPKASTAKSTAKKTTAKRSAAKSTARKKTEEE